MYIIYKDTNLTTGKSYIGITKHSVERRWQGKISKAYNTKINYKILNAIRQYGPDNWSHDVIDHCETLSEAFEKEIEYIQQYDTLRNGYNTTPGGHTPTSVQLSEKHKQSISEGMRKAYQENRRTKLHQTDEKKSFYRKLKSIGSWHTPFGTFESAREAANAIGTSKTNIQNWCRKYPDMKIPKITRTRLPHIFSQESTDLTYRQYGFSFSSNEP